MMTSDHPRDSSSGGLPCWNDRVRQVAAGHDLGDRILLWFTQVALPSAQRYEWVTVAGELLHRHLRHLGLKGPTDGQ